MKDYKKILEGLVNIINNTEKSDIGFANICTFIGENCPELKEYEDERIRKEILDYIDKATGCKRWVAWLEKQGEKPQGKTTLEDVNEEKFDNANKVEPKFNLYDWVVTDKGDTVQIVAVNNGYYTLHNGMDFNMSYVDKCWRKWTIQDAKDGDVLAAHECLVLFREIDGLNIRCYCTYHFMNNPSFYVDTLQNKDAFHPSTKEQCDTLMKAMSDAGYIFDFEKKELKEIEDEPNKCEGCNNVKGCIACVDGSEWAHIEEQKPTEWNEEDESNFQGIIDVIKENKHHSTDYEYMTYYKLLSWFKSLKDRYTWKLSDEQMKVCKEVYADLLSAKGFDVGTINSELNRLEEKLK